MTRGGWARLVTASALAACALVLAGMRTDPPHGLAPAAASADAALVLSGDVDYLRVERAAALYHAGAAPLLVLTGAGVGGDSAVEMRKQALAAGVPPEAIVTEERSRTTRENMLFVAPLVRARGWRRIALVTSASHMARAERAARRVMPEREWIPMPVADAGPAARLGKVRLQEWMKLLWYAARGWA